MPDLERAKVDAYIAKLNTLTSLKCSICSMSGHLSNQCWLNAQMAAQTRDDPDANEAWEMVKHHAVILKQQKQRAATEEFRKKLDARKLEEAGLVAAFKRKKK